MMAGVATRNYNLMIEGEPERLIGGAVTGDLFSLLGTRTVIGRGFLPEEDRPGAPRVMVLSHGLWQRQFGADPGVIGRTLMLNSMDYTVIGVASSTLTIPNSASLWVPLALDPAQTGRRNDFLVILGKLKDGVTREEASIDLKTIMSRLEQQYPQTNAGWSTEIVALHEQIVGESCPALLTLLAAVGFVLLIACANVANLLLARGAARQREISIRMALGAGRGRIVRQLLTESLLIAFIGGIAGLLIALWSVDLLTGLSSQVVPRAREISVDLRVLGFTFFVSLLTGLIFGAAPALHLSKAELTESLKEGGRAVAGSRTGQRLRNGLVITELALSLVLLIGAGLMVRSLHQLVNIDAGFNRDNLLTMQIPIPQARYAREKAPAFYEQLLDRTRGMPGVVAASVTSPLPLSGGMRAWSFAIEGRPQPPPEVVVDANVLLVGGGFFETMQIPLLRGRSINDQDNRGGPRVALINQSFVRRYFSEEDPLGGRFTFGNPEAEDPGWFTIVGVAVDSRHQVIEDEVYPSIYVPHGAQPFTNKALVVRTAVEPMSLASTVRAAVREMDRELPVYAVRSMDEVVSTALGDRQFSMMLLSIFAVVALVLAGLGIYGVISYSVSHRTHEMGVRVAVGAQRGDIMRLIIGQGMLLAVIGAALGLIAAAGLTRLISSQLVEVSTLDPLTFGMVTALVLIIALLACWAPARRATRVDPLTALRYE
jgi:putative ABC transport system permease protein